MKNIWKVRPVDMCIYIDEHIYEQDFDQDKIYGYLQWLFYILSVKKKYFKTADDYENYAIYGATQTYLRLTDKRQFLPEDDPKYMKRIKSVLNFIKRIMYPLKVNYQKSTFNEVIKFDEDVEYDGNTIYTALDGSISEQIYNNNAGFLQVDIESYIKTLKRMIMSTVKNTPYSNDPVMLHRLYMSCLISFLRSVTLSNRNKERLIENNHYKNVSQSYFDSIYAEEIKESPICYRLEDNYLPYIAALTQKVRKEAAKDIKSLINDYEPTENIIQEVLLASKDVKEEI